MLQAEPKKIVYLFGAGATHAEMENLGLVETAKAQEQRELLLRSVSRRVIEKARRSSSYRKGVDMVSATLGSPIESGSLNIELLISLIENSKIYGWEYKTRYLKKLVKEDIKAVLTAARIKRFYLHKALLELHEHEITKQREQV